jgi:hypothetical protein
MLLVVSLEPVLVPSVQEPKREQQVSQQAQVSPF